LFLSHQLPVEAPEPGKNYIAFVNYDYKNELEQFPEKNGNPLHFPKRILIEAEEVIALNEVDLSYEPKPGQAISLKPVVSKEQYMAHVNALKKHIQLGDIYEVNYCMSFEATDVEIDPVQLYQKLNSISKASYSALLKLGDQYIISSSPELFLSKRGDRLFTKPIKGTARRGATDAEDQRIKEELYHNAKERNENVMIVDVARNDLSRLATRGSVNVDALFDIESYRQVHQMVSTVSCSLKGDVTFDEMLAATFPMASMTGAPKYRAMQLIDHYEAYNRGPYSGSLGYVKANGDFDLNVLIRSVFYDASKRYLSFTVGSAITDLCKPEDEYEECLLKAKAMIEALGA
jgi:para-aminobenzoate synthetase component 1